MRHLVSQLARRQFTVGLLGGSILTLLVVGALLRVLPGLSALTGSGLPGGGGGVEHAGSSAEVPATTHVSTDFATADAQPQSAAGASAADESASFSEPITLPRESWSAAGIALQPVQQAPFSQTLELTGKIGLNEDRVAHIFPLIDGRVHEVRIQLGEKVTRGQVLAVVQSTEVGRSMLQLFQNRLQRDFAHTKDQWTQTVSANTQAMIALMRSGAAIEEIEKQLTDRPMGDYRDKLMAAYVAFYKARLNLERLKPLSENGTITGKQLLEAESEWNASRATLQSLLEELQQVTQQTSILSTQSLKELETRVAVDETNLKILGFDTPALASIDPATQGETVAHYPIHSPFDGTIISKDVVLMEHVGPERQILSIADLSTVWVNTDVYEEHLPLLKQMEHGELQLHSPAWPGRTFTAKVFYTGDVVDESSRTVAMRAVADNSAGDLKPGMFVTVTYARVSPESVLQVPLSAVLEHAGRTFVFVHMQDDQFQAREVALGRRNVSQVEVTKGLQAGEQVAIAGGFALKSRMLAELLAE